MRFTQRETKYLQKLAGAQPDGKIGPRTLAKMRAMTDFKGNDKLVVVYFAQWSYNRSNLGKKLTLDGIFGPMTDVAVDKLVQANTSPSTKKRTRVRGREYALCPSAKILLPIKPPLAGTASLKRFYGAPGDQRQLVKMFFPHKMYYGSSRVRSTRVHRKAKESFEYCMEKDLEHYGQDGLDDLRISAFSGCFNFRRMRGGDAYSTHSWAIAMDSDAMNNRMRYGRERAHFARADYQEYWNHKYQAGFKGLGFTGVRVGRPPSPTMAYDFMHTQLTR